MRVVETVWNTLKVGGIEEGKGNKKIKKGSKLGQGVGALRGRPSLKELCRLILIEYKDFEEGRLCLPVNPKNLDHAWAHIPKTALFFLS